MTQRAAGAQTVDGLLAFAGEAADRLRRDERVRVVWLTGSLASGTGDAFSDVDLRLAVRNDHFASIGEWWPELIEAVAPTAWRRLWHTSPALALLGAITTDYRRFDLVVQPTDAAPAALGAARVLVDKDGTAVGLVAPDAAAPPPDLRGRTPWVVEEFIRRVGQLDLVVGRGDVPMGMEGQLDCHSMLIALLLLENGIDRAAAGKRQVAALLDDEQRAVLASVPALEPTMDSVIRGRAAYARLFLPRARRLMAARGLTYPQAFEDATRRHLRATLDLDI